MLLPKKHKGRFINSHIDDDKRRWIDFAKWKLFRSYKDPVIDLLPPNDFIYPTYEREIQTDQPLVTWVNHSTFLIHVGGYNILTDPVWSDVCSPLPFMGPKRRHDPAISIEHLPEIDFVLISHNHYDHMDKKTIFFLNRSFPEIRWIVPCGMKKWFVKRHIKNVYELTWWQDKFFDLENDVQFHIHATPTQHFSGRGIKDTNKTLWGSYVVEVKTPQLDKKFYFTGDTGYNSSDFQEIGKKFKKFDLSLIPIGAYAPRDFMKPMHINPADAVKIHLDVGSKFSIGMHWKTFHLSDEHHKMPPYDLFLAMKKASLDPRDFIALDPGEYVNW